jgi:hypothetical protein
MKYDMLTTHTYLSNNQYVAMRMKTAGSVIYTGKDVA